MVKPTYRKLFSYPQLRLETARLNEYMLQYPIHLEHSLPDKSSLFGIEVEVENLEDYTNAHPFWTVTEDGSLRNYGREYISRPLRGPQVEYALQLLFEKLKKYPYQFTPRCSIHVHCNARTMTQDQLNNMMMLYLIFERLLFKFVGQDRDKNIHCVPLYESNIVKNIVDVIYCRQPPSLGWMKYTAVNLVPLAEKGTIEFRHLHGTDDITKIMTWINLILKMKLYAYKTEVDIVKQEIFSLNSNSQYAQFCNRVFGEFAPVLIANLSYKEYSTYMEDGVKLAKSCFSVNKFADSININKETKFAKLTGYSSTARLSNKKPYASSFSFGDFVNTVSVNSVPPPSPPGAWVVTESGINEVTANLVSSTTNTQPEF